MRLSSVDLPEPDGPISAVKLPDAISRLKSVKTSIFWVSRWNDL